MSRLSTCLCRDYSGDTGDSLLATADVLTQIEVTMRQTGDLRATPIAQHPPSGSSHSVTDYLTGYSVQKLLQLHPNSGQSLPSPPPPPAHIYIREYFTPRGSADKLYFTNASALLLGRQSLLTIPITQLFDTSQRPVPINHLKQGSENFFLEKAHNPYCTMFRGSHVKRPQTLVYLMLQFYSICRYIIYKCCRGSPNTTWRTEGCKEL